MWGCKLYFEDPQTQWVVIKATREGRAGESHSRDGRLWTEAYFYQQMAADYAKHASINFPTIHLAIADPESGRQIVVMENLKPAKSLHNFDGDGWKEVQAVLGDSITVDDMIGRNFEMISDFHIEHWCDTEFAEKHNWLSGYGPWIRREGKEAFENILGSCKRLWSVS